MRNKISMLLICLLGAVLPGCATTYKNADELISSPKTVKKTQEFAMNYQQAYRVLVGMTRKCLQGSVMGNQRRTEEHLDNERQIGEISYINHNAFWGEDYWGYYILKPVDGDKAELISYHAVGKISSADNSAYLKAWIEGRDTCFF